MVLSLVKQDSVEYRLIDGFRGAYRIGTDGSLWSRHKRKNGKSILGDWKQLNPVARGHKLKYRMFDLSLDGKKYPRMIHLLVLSAFVGPCPDEMEGMHLNGNSLDNRLSNLKYGTHQENCDQIQRAYGDDCPVTKIPDKFIPLIREMKKRHPRSGEFLGRWFGVTKNQIWLIDKGKTRLKAAGGKHW